MGTRYLGYAVWSLVSSLWLQTEPPLQNGSALIWDILASLLYNWRKWHDDSGSLEASFLIMQ